MTLNDSNIKSWLGGIPCETSFWENLFSHKGSREWILHSSGLGHEMQLHNFDTRTFLSQQSDGTMPMVVDLGCGLSYITGNMIDGQPINIHYVDPLAHFYNDILHRHHVDAPRIEFGMMEHFASCYPDNSLSLIIIQNALDHSSDPMRGIIESLRTLRKGGVLYLKHYPNEAQKEAYRGFHQFNICREGDDIVIWNKTSRHSLSQTLCGFAEVKASSWDNPEEVIAVITKTADVPANLYDDRADISLLSEQLLTQARLTHSLSFVARYQLSKLFYAAARPIAYYSNRNLIETARKLFRQLRK